MLRKAMNSWKRAGNGRVASPSQRKVEQSQELSQRSLIHDVHHTHFCDQEVQDTAPGGHWKTHTKMHQQWQRKFFPPNTFMKNVSNDYSLNQNIYSFSFFHRLVSLHNILACGKKNTILWKNIKINSWWSCSNVCLVILKHIAHTFHTFLLWTARKGCVLSKISSGQISCLLLLDQNESVLYDWTWTWQAHCNGAE